MIKRYSSLAFGALRLDSPILWALAVVTLVLVSLSLSPEFEDYGNNSDASGSEMPRYIAVPSAMVSTISDLNTNPLAEVPSAADVPVDLRTTGVRELHLGSPRDPWDSSTWEQANFTPTHLGKVRDAYQSLGTPIENDFIPTHLGEARDAYESLGAAIESGFEPLHLGAPRDAHDSLSWTDSEPEPVHLGEEKPTYQSLP